MSVFSDVKKALKRISRLDDDLKRAFREVKKQADVIDDIQRARRWAGGRINDIDDTLEKLPARIEDEVEETVTEKLPDLIEDAARAIAKEAAKVSIAEVLDNAADCIEVMAPSKFTLVFGIEMALVVQGEVTVQFTFPNPVARLTEIRKWADDPPSGRKQIIECIKDFGPDSVGAEFKVSGNGLSAEWDGDEKYDRIDAFLKKHGVD